MHTRATYIRVMKNAAKATRKAEAVSSTLVRETDGAWWYDVTMSDGRVILMSVPK